MPTIKETEAFERACPYNNFNPCLGARCMAWMWSGPDADQCVTDNLVEPADGTKPIGDPPVPDGFGWIADGQTMAKSYHRRAKDGKPTGTMQHWIRQRDQALGYCARVGTRNDHHVEF